MTDTFISQRRRLEQIIAHRAYMWFRSRFEHPCQVNDYLYLLDETKIQQELLGACQELHELFAGRATTTGDY